MQKLFVEALLLAGVIASSETNGYTDAQAQISLQLSQDAYCGRSQYKSHVFEGAAKGFVATKTIYNILYDVEGFVGYLPSDNSIYVSYRGSESINNWVTNFDATQDAYAKWPECNCQVHAGFQKAITSVYDEVLAEVHRLRAKYPTYSVKTTGHSLGAALAAFNAMGFLKDGIPTTMINFGQPRIGDDAFATFSTGKLTQFRVTHYRDPVPNIPPRIPIEYHHTAYEIYEDQNGSVKQCNSTGEDKTCTDQWYSWQYSVADHLVYLGMCMGEDCGNCAASFLQ